jgi:hypothetical protein
MFGSIDRSKGYLFSTYDLSENLRRTVEKLKEEIQTLDSNRLLNTAPEDLKRYLVEKHSIQAIRLLRDDWYADTQETKVDVRYDPMRWIDDKSRPALVPGERTEVRVPFEGESELFYSQPNAMTTSPPQAVIEKNELVLRYVSPSDAPREIRPLVEHTLAAIEQYLGWQRNMIEAHNNALPSLVEQSIEQRRTRLLALSQRAVSLGIPIKRRDGVPTTYAIPTTRKKALPVLPPASSAPFTPDHWTS